MKQIKLNEDIIFGGAKPVIVAGPCAIEDDISITMKTAEELKKITTELGIPYIFKASFDKANRSSIDSYRGVGIEKGLKILQKVKSEFNLPILTDIHEASQAPIVAEIADVIQIPAFLCRQTDLLVATAKTGKIVNIKKGQFVAPNQMANSARKVSESGNDKIIFTERGTCFGYGNLVVDMRAIPIMQSLGYPVMFDATHSVQLPGGAGTSTSGERQYVFMLAKCAISAGANALFFEVHPNPDCAPCDGPNMIYLKDAKNIFAKCNELFYVINS